MVYINIRREVASGTNNYGEPNKPQWTDIAKDVPCALDPVDFRRQGIQMTPAGQDDISSYLMVFAPDVDVKSRDQIIDYSGNKYKVLDVRDYSTHTEAYCDKPEK